MERRISRDEERMRNEKEITMGGMRGVGCSFLTEERVRFGETRMIGMR